MGGIVGRRRKLDNWLESFLEWTMPRSETPESMLRWAGIFTLATVMKRKVWWPEFLLGGYTLFPSFYIVLVGEPAVVRKSTTVGFSERLLKAYNMDGGDPITFSGDVTSHSKLLAAMADSPDSSIAIVASEFSSLIQTTPEAMYETLTDIFDNKDKHDWSTWAHGDKSITEPVINLIAASTPAWIAAQPPEYFVGGGFASRVLFLYEEEPRQKEIFYDHLDQEKLKTLAKGLSDDLKVIAEVKGAFGFDDNDTKEYIRSWYKSAKPQIDDPRQKGYFGRKHAHALKLSILLSLAERDDRKVTKEHFDEAIKMLDYIEIKLSKAFSSLGANPFAIIMGEILEYIKEKKKASLRDIAGRFYKGGLTLEQLKSALAFLCTTGKVKASGIEDITYKYTGE
ncbi:hypothetical protein LCGC14_2002390 [marine sediment metagenome]|uniref:DUF3987 domain-containing protein n=1 Tax=marine sediment metagenome TaxID=412755 RepID=A0A0F9F2Q9_9ZZZZ